MESSFFCAARPEPQADAKKEQIVRLLETKPELADLILAIAGGAN